MTEIQVELNNEDESQEPESNAEIKFYVRPEESSLSWGIALMIIGGLFLLDNFGIVQVAKYNWWAGFILVPGINMLWNALIYYRQSGKINKRARQSSFWGVILIALAFIFLFNLDFGLLFPVFMILLGIYLLSSRS